MTVAAALELKGLEYERVDLPMPHAPEMAKIYGEDRTTVPGMLIDGEQVHGSRAIIERLEAIRPEPTLYPGDAADEIREAERWGDEELQDLGRRFPWGALHFRPEAMGTFGGAGPLDGPGTDYAMKFVHATWKYHRISGEVLERDLAAFPEKIDHIDRLAQEGVIGGELPNAADLQIGATIRVILVVGDLVPLIEGRAAERIARRWFPEYGGSIPAGAFPANWLPQAGRGRYRSMCEPSTTVWSSGSEKYSEGWIEFLDIAV